MASLKKTARPLGVTEGASTNTVAPSFFSMVILDLPCPPSLNNSTFDVTDKTGKSLGRRSKQHVKDWRAYARREIAAQYLRQTITQHVLVVVNVERASFSADIDNRMKLLFDVLVKQRVIKDDSLITGFATAWAEPGTKRVRLAIVPVQQLDIRFQPSTKHKGACGGWFLNAPETAKEAQ